MAFDQVISVGFRCHTANHFRRMMLHTISMPFDFIVSTPQGVAEAITSRFEGVLQPEKLVPCGDYVLDPQYGFQHWHDHTDLANPIASNDTVISKRTYVTNRFYKLLESRMRVLFVRQEEPNKGSVADAQMIIDALRKFRPADSFYFLYLSTNVSDAADDHLMTLNVPDDGNLPDEVWNSVMARVHARERIKLYSPALLRVHDSLPPSLARSLFKTIGTARKRSAQLRMLSPA